MKPKAWQIVAARTDKYFLRESSAEIADNDELVAAAVERFGIALEFASKRLQETKQIVMCAVSNDCRALRCAGPNMQDDLDVVMAAVASQNNAAKANGQSRIEVAFLAGDETFVGGFACASARIRDMADVALASVAGVGVTLKCVSDRLQNDREIVLAAVRRTGWALRYASRQLRADPEIVQTALAQSALAIEFVPDELLTFDTVLAAVKSAPETLSHIAARWKENREIVCAAVAVDGCALEHAAASLKDDPEVVRLAVENTPLAYQFAGAKAAKSEELLKLAVVGGLLLPEKQFKNAELACIFLENIRRVQSSETEPGLSQTINVQNWYSGDWLKKILKLHTSSKEVATAAIRCSGNSSSDTYFMMVDASVRDDKAFCLAAIRKEPYLYRLVSEDMQSERELIQAYAESGFADLDEVPRACQEDVDIVKMFATLSPSSIRGIPEKFHSLKEVRVAIASNSFDGSDLTDEDILGLARDENSISMLLNTNPELFFRRDGLQGDRRTLMAAARSIRRNDPLQIVSALACDRELLNALPFVPRNICSEIADDLTYVCDAVVRGAQEYGELSEKWKNDRKVCEAFIERSADRHDCYIAILPKVMREDRELMLFAVSRGSLPELQVLPKRLQADEGILEAFYQRMEYESTLPDEEFADH